MIDNSLGEQYLRIYDELNFDNQASRRVGFCTLENYYATVMEHVGTEVLNTGIDIFGENLAEQWTVTKQILETVDREPPSEFEGILQEVKKHRGNLYHNFREDIPQRRLDAIRDVAEEWRAWLIDCAREYWDTFGAYTLEDFDYIANEINDYSQAYMGDIALKLPTIKRELDYAFRTIAKQRHRRLHYLETPDIFLYDLMPNKTSSEISKISTTYGKIGMMASKIKKGEEIDTDEGEDLMYDARNILISICEQEDPFGRTFNNLHSSE
ncbi:hypothetical protein [Halomarina ordinaria]|uniref:DUF4145 domain-containing protein n=1 Tax=Halomarina ordinaria TaxID=3033939 RepID=A0ABD5U8R9_9EURY|nr:hypothetical protein [Halomarina sp. PSRA2]